MSYTVKTYSATFYRQWNDFVALSKNSTFLFHRDFMEYHSDRFADHSLIVFEGSKIIALLPANRVGENLYSHQGLTYGGLILGSKAKLSQVITVLKCVLEYLHSHGISRLHVKAIPHIYHKLPAEEMNYALFTANAQLVRRDSLSVYDMQGGLTFSKDRKQCIRRGEHNGLVIVEEPEFKLFWDMILIPNLELKHGASPVHTLQEIELLHNRFPNNIRHFNVYHNDCIVAGTTIFVTDTVAHPQYISGNADKNQLGSLDYLYAYLITNIFADKKYFDFGISNEQQGRKVNEGLVFWKESFGARTITQDFYEVPTANYLLLDDVLI